MLSSLLKEHQQRQHLRREEQERKKKEATAAASALTAAMVDHLNVGVAQAYLNQRKLDAEAKQLHTNATNFSKQAANWLHLVDNFNHALKEVFRALDWEQLWIRFNGEYLSNLRFADDIALPSNLGDESQTMITGLDRQRKMELGDIENWAKSIEADMRTVSSALEYAYKVGQQGS